MRSIEENLKAYFDGLSEVQFKSAYFSDKTSTGSENLLALTYHGESGGSWLDTVFVDYLTSYKASENPHMIICDRPTFLKLYKLSGSDNPFIQDLIEERDAEHENFLLAVDLIKLNYIERKIQAVTQRLEQINSMDDAELIEKGINQTVIRNLKNLLR